VQTRRLAASFEASTRSVTCTGTKKFPRKATCVSALFFENPPKRSDANVLTQVQVSKMGFLRRLHSMTEGCAEVWWRPGQETSLVPLCLVFGSEWTVLKKKLATLLGLFDTPQWFSARGIVPPSLHPRCDTSRQSAHLWNFQSPECWTTCPKWEITATLVQLCIKNAPRKTGEASPAG